MTLDWLWQNQKRKEEPIQELPRSIKYRCGCSFDLWDNIPNKIEICQEHWRKFDNEPIGYLVHCMRTGNYPPMPKHSEIEK